MENAKIFIVVKTYPSRSSKYIETVCTAGFREDGSWIRLYPIPFRFCDYQNRYKKYQWIEAKIEKNTKDTRPESYRIVDVKNIKPGELIDTKKDGWEKRKDIIFKKSKIYKNKNEIINLAYENKISLAIFKPKKFINFHVKDVDKKKQEIFYRGMVEQPDFFDLSDTNKRDLMPLLSKKFFYEFIDDQDKKSTLSIIDWEVGQLYLNCLKNSNSEEEAVEKVKKQYLDNFFQKKDLYLYLGTTYKWHYRKPKNPFVIIGVFYPPR